MYSESSKKATLKYIKNNCYCYSIRFPKELEPVLKEAANGNVGGYIKELVYNDLINKQFKYDGTPGKYANKSKSKTKNAQQIR